MLTMRKRPWILLAVAVLAALGAAGYLARGELRAWAFSVTGEEDTLAQIRGVGQLALNLTHRPLKLEAETATNYGGVYPYGINTFLHQEVEPEKREESLRLIAAAGFRWIRQEFPWADIEVHGRGDFIDRRNDPAGVDAWAKYDQIVDLAEQYNVQIIARLSSPPAWSRAAGDSMGAFAPPDDFDDYANFAAAVAERYRGRIRFYQVWNEPNIYPEWGEQLVSPEGYTDLLCRAYRAIKTADPDAVVLSAPLAPTVELSGRDFNDYLFLQRMYDAGAGDCFDILSVQDYGLWSGPTDRRIRPFMVNYARPLLIRDMMVRNGDAGKAMWISEMNWNAAPEDVDPRYGRVTLEQQAQYAVLAYQRAQREWPWVGVVAFWYFKRADYEWLDGRRPEAYFQMADPDFNLMPVYSAVQELTSQPPVMYAGGYYADHWAVSYGEGWQPWPGDLDRARAASEGAEPVSFMFSGSALRIVLSEGRSPGAGVTLSVDGGPAREALQWRGGRGLHTAVIEPVGTPVIAQFVVRDAPRWWLWALIGAGLLAGGGLGIYRVRRARQVHHSTSAGAMSFGDAARCADRPCHDVQEVAPAICRPEGRRLEPTAVLPEGRCAGRRGDALAADRGMCARA